MNMDLVQVGTLVTG